MAVATANLELERRGCCKCRHRLLLSLCVCLFRLTACASPDHWPKVLIVNKSPVELTLYWMASDTDLRPLANLRPGETNSLDTFVGHRFRLKPGEGVHEVSSWADVEVTGQGEARIVTKGGNLEVEWSRHSSIRPKPESGNNEIDDAAVTKLGKEKAEECVRNLQFASDSGQDPKAYDEDADLFCRKYPTRELISSKVRYSEDFWQHYMTNGGWKNLAETTATQPAALHNFTTSGFQLLRRHDPMGPAHGGLLDAPFQEDLDRAIRWYEDSRSSAAPEEHGIFDPAVSSYESDTWILHPPKEISRPILKEIKRGLERWAGLPEDSLQYIAFYGPRLYRNGSLLRQHVDIWETHVLSAIISVGKRGVLHPWPLQIVHHDGSKHEVDDSPGDVIFYESATCPHARDGSRLQGREVANMFAHFRPTEWKPLDGSHLHTNAHKVVQHPVEL